MTPASNRGLWRWHAGALAIYAALALVFIYHGESLSSRIQGFGSDPIDCIWFLAWWPWAITHHVNPLYTNLVWQPLGIYLVWITSLPFLSIISWPITKLWGPVVSYNLLKLGAPVLAAWAAYFLCLKLTRVPFAAIIGGFLFGFSSYEMAQEMGSLDLSFIAFVPLCLLIVLARLNDELSIKSFVPLVTAVLACQFLICIEVFAMIFIFGGLAWLLALYYFPTRTAVLRRLFFDGLITAPFIVGLIFPFLLSMFLHYGFIHHPDAWPYYFTADFVNIFVPDEKTLVGGNLFRFISDNFTSDFQERGTYIGVPLLLILVLFATGRERFPSARFLLSILLIFIVASFGPRLWIDGHYSAIVLPWVIFVHLPLISSALPARFALFSSLVVAIIVTLWLAEPVLWRRRRWRIALAIVACIALLPRPQPWIKIPHSEFFRPGRVEAVLGPNPRIMVLPFSINGPSSFWQQESHFSFAQTGGYLGFPPAAMQNYAAVGQLFGNVQEASFLNDFVEFVTSTNTEYVVAGPGTPAKLLSRLAELNWPTKKADDVIIITVPNSNTDTIHG